MYHLTQHSGNTAQQHSPVLQHSKAAQHSTNLGAAALQQHLLHSPFTAAPESSTALLRYSFRSPAAAASLQALQQHRKPDLQHSPAKQNGASTAPVKSPAALYVMEYTPSLISTCQPFFSLAGKCTCFSGVFVSHM